METQTAETLGLLSAETLGLFFVGRNPERVMKHTDMNLTKIAYELLKVLLHLGWEIATGYIFFWFCPPRFVTEPAAPRTPHPPGNKP